MPYALFAYESNTHCDILLEIFEFQLKYRKLIDTFFKSIGEALIKKKSIELRGFGTFFIKEIKEKYSARNPKTGGLIYVPKKNKVRFRTSKKFKQFLNQ